MAHAKKKKETKAARTKKTLPRGEENVVIEIDRALERAWKQASTALAASKTEGARAWDRFWETVGAILDHEPPLYLAGGVSTTREFLAKYADGVDARVARRNVRVAKVASPNEEARYTVMKLDEILSYLDAKLGGAPKGRVPVDFAKIRVPVKGHPRGLALDAVTVQQIRAATQALHPKHAAKTSPVIAELLRALHGVTHGNEVGVHYANGYVSLNKIPAHAFRGVMHALAKAKVPTPVVR